MLNCWTEHSLLCCDCTESCLQVNTWFLLLRVNIYIEGYICSVYAEECKLVWIGMFARERASDGLSQWRWPGGGLLRGQWWPWRWGPGCGWCYSFCRGHVRPEGSSPGYPPLRAESHSPAGHRYSVSPQTQTEPLATLTDQAHSFALCAHTLNETFTAV